MILKGKMKDGSNIELLYEDKGDLIPAYDKDGKRYEAWTSQYRSSDGSEDIYEYSIVSKTVTDKLGNVAKTRREADKRALAFWEIDFDSLVVVRESNPESTCPW